MNNYTLEHSSMTLAERFSEEGYYTNALFRYVKDVETYKDVISYVFIDDSILEVEMYSGETTVYK